VSPGTVRESPTRRRTALQAALQALSCVGVVAQTGAPSIDHLEVVMVKAEPPPRVDNVRVAVEPSASGNGAWVVVSAHVVSGGRAVWRPVARMRTAQCLDPHGPVEVLETVALMLLEIGVALRQYAEDSTLRDPQSDGVSLP
jgi:hypothetical protein